jgi:membrane protease YdiL (CAAX protease family)
MLDAPGATTAPAEHERVGLLVAVCALVLAFPTGAVASKLALEVFAPNAAGRSKASGMPPTAAVVPTMIALELTFVLVAFAVPLLRGLRPRRALGLQGSKLRVFVAAAIGTVMLGPLGDTLMSTLSALFPNLGGHVITELREVSRKLPLLQLWPALALMPGLGEELLVRGMLQRAIAPSAWAVALSAGVFAAMHVDPIHVAGVLPLGIFLAWTAHRTQSTLVTIVAHVANNSFALLTIRSQALDVGYATGQELPAWWLACSLVCVAASAWVIVRGTDSS